MSAIVLLSFLVMKIVDKHQQCSHHYITAMSDMYAAHYRRLNNNMKKQGMRYNGGPREKGD